MSRRLGRYLFFFNDTSTTEIYTLSLHDALPISSVRRRPLGVVAVVTAFNNPVAVPLGKIAPALFFGNSVRSEEHTSELQSQSNLVCRLLLEKKKKRQTGKPLTYGGDAD